jgi:tetratricopeptide (TPR) repeat protein
MASGGLTHQTEDSEAPDLHGLQVRPGACRPLAVEVVMTLAWLVMAVVAQPTCAQPVLAPGQEQAIDRMVTPAKLPAGVVAGDTQVLRDRVRAHFQAGSVRLDYELTPHAAAPVTAPRTARFALQRVAPCANPAARCEVDTKLLAEVDKALLDAVVVGEDAVQWTCPQETAAGGLGATLRAIDAALGVANTDAANTTLDAALKARPWREEPPATRADLALLLQRMGRAALAAQVLDELLAGPPPATEDQVMRERWAAALALRGRKPEAAQTLAGCAACSPVPLADALELAGDVSGAAGVLDAALKPGAPVGLYRARIGLASRSNDAAAEVRTAEAALKVYPDDQDLRESLASALFRARRHGEAIAALEAVLQREPKRPHVLGRIAGIFNDMGGANGGQPMPGWGELRESMRQRAARSQTDAVAQFLQAVNEFYETKFDAALARLRTLEPLAPAEGRIYIYQAMAHLWLGRDAEAEKLVHKAMETNPHDPDVYYCLSQVVRKRDIPAAITALDRYVALSSAPGALEFPKKTERVRQELTILRAGKLPPLWDKPGHFADDATKPMPDRPTAWPRQLAVALAVLVAVVAGFGWRRRKRS